MTDRLAAPRMDEFEWISAAGSHTHCAARHPGLGAVYLRQFSDFQPGGPILVPAAGLRVAGRPDERYEIETVRWRPDGVRSEGRFGPVTLRQEISYCGADAVIAEIECGARGNRSVEMEIFTGCHPHAHAETTPTDNGLRIRITHNAHPMWGQAIRFDETFEIAVEGELARADHGGWRFTVPADGVARVRIAMLRKGAATDRTLAGMLADPDACRALLRADLDAWMQQMPALRTDDADLLGQARFCWYWPWFNTASAAGCWKTPGVTPSRVVYGRGVWLWDSAFHIFGLAHGGPEARRLCAGQVEILIDNMVDGRLPREVWVETPGHDLQAPGVLTQAALRLLELDPGLLDADRLYERLRTNFDWFRAERGDPGTGLCVWDGCDSGWDTSPRWDQGRPIAVDLASWMVIDARGLARLARRTGRDAEATELDALAGDLAERARNLFWHDEDGLFYDRLQDGSWVRVVSPVSFWAMYAGIATTDQARRVAARLADPDSFGQPFPIASVSPAHPAHRPDEYWRGPVWVNLNWISIRGLQRYGLDDEAARLRQRTLRMIAGNPVTHEYYRPDTGEAIGAPDYCWTATLFIDLLADPDGDWLRSCW